MRDDATLRCAGCGYDLRGLPENRCPECGREFDPASPHAELPPGQQPRWMFCVACLGLVGAAMTPLAYFGTVPCLSAPLGIVVAVYCGVKAVVCGARALRKPADTRDGRGVWLVVLVLGLLSLGAVVTFVALAVTIVSGMAGVRE